MEEQSYSEPVGEAWKYDPQYHRVSDFLGINVYDRNEDHLAKKVLAIREWANQEGKSDDTTQALTQISKFQRKQGYQMVGKSLVNQLYQDIRLHQDQQRSQPSTQKTQKTVLKSKPNNIQKAVAETVQQSVAGMVQQALGDKKLIQNTVQNAIKEALK